MPTDAELRAHVLERLDTIPCLNADAIEVVVVSGLVTLNGQVDTHQTRFHVERVARRVPGIRGLQVQIGSAAMASKGGSGV